MTCNLFSYKMNYRNVDKIWNGYVNNKIHLPISHLVVRCHPGSHPLAQRPSIGSQADVPRQCPQDLEQLYPYVPGEHSTKTCFQCIKSSCYESLLLIIVPPKV